MLLGALALFSTVAAAEPHAGGGDGAKETLDRAALFYPRMLFDQRAPMRDATQLVADVYLPREPGRYPAILVRTAYDRSSAKYREDGRYFAAQGYAVVIQDVRGRGDSGGEFEAFFQEDVDGYDTVEWVARQPWCDGKVGMMGVSYDGFVQWAAAKLKPPHLAALVSDAAVGRTFREYWYTYGAVNLYPLQWYFYLTGNTNKDYEIVDWKRVFRHLPLSTMDEAAGLKSLLWKDYIEHSSFDSYWKRMDLSDHFPSIDVPALHLTGWFDWDLPGQMFYYQGMASDSPARDRQWLIVGPWTHGGTRKPQLGIGGIEFEKEAIMDTRALRVAWFDHWLKGERQNGIAAEPKVKYYSMGENRWRTAPTWPPPESRAEHWYLHSGGAANTMAGDGELSRTAPGREKPDRYVYNPEHPVPTTKDPAMSATSMDDLDQRFVERRDDVLVYTTKPLTERVAIAGEIKLILYASSDARDTDFMAKLIDVYPDERALMMGPGVGVIRARFRDSLSAPTLIEPGKIYRYEIDLNHLAHVFLPGHRIRVEVSSSNFPLYDRNPNTGAPIGQTIEMQVARQTIYHDREHPSMLILPLVR